MNYRKLEMSFSACLAGSAVLMVLTLPAAQAAGKKQPGSGATPAPQASTPTPVRGAVLKSVGTQAFNLPNGSRVNLSADLDSMLLSAVANTTAFSPQDPNSEDPCNSRVEVRAAVTSLDFNVGGVNLKVGYTPGGEHSPVTSVNGKVGVNIGTIAMDFSVWECQGSRCQSVAATTATHAMVDGSLSFEIDFGQVKAGPELLYNTQLGVIIRKIMTKGMSELSKSSRLSELSWKARVREYNSADGVLIFDAGTRQRLAPQQTFVVYAANPQTGACDVYKSVAYIRTTQVDAVSSVAVVDSILDSRSIQPGDVVMVRSSN